MLEFDAASHTYRIDGHAVPSVTQILAGLGCYAGIPADALARKADIGDAVHYCTELYDQGMLDITSVPDEAAGYLAGWIQFRAETGFEALEIEARVYHETFRYAGTLDRIGKFARLKGLRQGALALVDIKCTYAIMPSVGAQTAAYQAAWDSTADRDHRVDRRYAVQLRPDGTYRLEEQTDRSDLSVFLAAATLWHWRQSHSIGDQK